MLILLRQVGQSIRIEDVIVKILNVKGDKVKIEITLPEGMDESKVLIAEAEPA